MKRMIVIALLPALLVVALLCACAPAQTQTVAAALPAETAPVTPLPTATPSPTPTPTPTSTPTPTPIPTPFSMIWLPDTQQMTYNNPDPLAAMGDWIADNIESENIRWVVQTGDSVENGFAPRHWNNFDLCYKRFSDRVPYFPVAGNHDIAVNHHDYAAYLERPYFDAFPPEALFERGKALYAEVREGGMNLLLLGAGWEAEQHALGWMNEVVRAHPNDDVILLFHGYISGSGKYTVEGKIMFEQLVRPNPNVKLVLCGHCSGLDGVRLEKLDDDGDGTTDREVYAMMFNYQSIAARNAGQLRILRFEPMERSLTVTTYSPYTDRYYRDGEFRSETFTLENIFRTVE